MIRKKILFLCPYPFNLAPSQRFRYEQYLDQLTENGYTFDLKPFLTPSAYTIIYQSGNSFSKISTIAYSYLKRWLLLLRMSHYDWIFIHRETLPAGPPILEWIIARIFRKKIIYDFDDAIWLTDKTDQSVVSKIVRWRSKVSAICGWSTVVSCGNQYLARYARQFNTHVVVNPTTIDTVNVHNPALFGPKESNACTIGWTGSHSTLKYLEALEPVLQKIQSKYPQVTFIVIADRPPQMDLKRLIFCKWSNATEIEDLMRLDIGIMPLPDDEWTKGKCGFKALQYMALGIPAVVSPVGVNTEIVQDGIEGYWCSLESEWLSRLEQLIVDKHERSRMGKRGRQTVIQRYSVASNTSNFLSLFK